MDAATSPAVPDPQRPEASVPLELLASGLPLDAIRLWLLVRATAGADYTPTTALTRTSMAGTLGTSTRSINAHLDRLTSDGWLHREHRQNLSSALSTTWPVPW